MKTRLTIGSVAGACLAIVLHAAVARGGAGGGFLPDGAPAVIREAEAKIRDERRALCPPELPAELRGQLDRIARDPQLSRRQKQAAHAELRRENAEAFARARASTDACLVRNAAQWIRLALLERDLRQACLPPPPNGGPFPPGPGGLALSLDPGSFQGPPGPPAGPPSFPDGDEPDGPGAASPPERGAATRRSDSAACAAARAAIAEE
jgi:hypothetical protein